MRGSYKGRRTLLRRYLTQSRRAEREESELNTAGAEQEGEIELAHERMNTPEEGKKTA